MDFAEVIRKSNRLAIEIADYADWEWATNGRKYSDHILESGTQIGKFLEQAKVALNATDKLCKLKEAYYAAVEASYWLSIYMQDGCAKTELVYSDYTLDYDDEKDDPKFMDIVVQCNKLIENIKLLFAIEGGK